MRMGHLIAPLTAVTVAVITLGQAAHADLLINIDKSAQRMTVTVNEEQLYDWPVSSGGSGYDTPAGTFKPFRMEIDHHSDEWDNAPMPYSIFFTKIGHAIHGTLCAAQSWSGGVAWLRAAVGEECRHAVETGEAGEDGQYHRGVKRRDPRCQASNAPPDAAKPR